MADLDKVRFFQVVFVPPILRTTPSRQNHGFVCVFVEGGSFCCVVFLTCCLPFFVFLFVCRLVFSLSARMSVSLSACACNHLATDIGPALTPFSRQVIGSGMIVPISTLCLAPQESISLVVVFTPPNYLTDESCGGKIRGVESHINIKMLQYDHNLLEEAMYHRCAFHVPCHHRLLRGKKPDFP